MSMDKLNRKADQMKGKTKEHVGELTGNEKLANEGRADQISSKARQVGDDVKRAAKDATHR
jgi:uncharacterized protein YjbJ (UPF0337 family)